MSKKILIVEDDGNIRELLRLYLEKDGYTGNIADEPAEPEEAEENEDDLDLDEI